LQAAVVVEKRTAGRCTEISNNGANQSLLINAKTR